MAAKVSLFNDSNSSGDESETDLKINKEYAKRYDHWREKELLQKYKDLQEEVSSSSSESEEDVPEVDENFFRVLSLLKGRDPKIYDKNFTPFNEAIPKTKNKKKKEKPISMKDYERKVVLEKNGDISEEEDIPNEKTANERELANLKNAIMEDDDDDETEECIKSVNNSKETEGEEPEDFIKFLKGKNVEIPDDSKKDLSYLRECWNDPNLDEDEKFLRDFFLNKTYLKDDDFSIVQEMERLSEEEKIEDEQEMFEHKYNFRFEEPDQEFIKRYPRTVGESLRRKDTRRKMKREDYNERKQHEKEQKREELKRLKALKRKEIEEKFFKLQEVTGKEDLNLDESDIENDFDPDKHDQKMKELFDEEYYAVEEEQKPVFSYDEEIDEEDWNHWTRTNAQNQKQDDDEQIIDTKEVDDSETKANIKSEFEQEMLEYTQERKKKGRKKSLFAKIVANPKPIYDPEGKSFDEYLDEYYKMDYEDVIGDLPVRFKYRKVIPNDFGLTVDEILKADDKDLNRWCSIKKTCQYRQETEEQYDVQAFRKKAEMPVLKQKYLPSLYAQDEEETKTDIDNNDSQKSKRKKKKSKKNKLKLENQDLELEEHQDFNSNDSSPNKKIKLKQPETFTNSQDASHGKKKKSKKGKLSKNDCVSNNSVKQESDLGVTTFAAEDEVTSENNNITDNHQRLSKRKRKRSKKNNPEIISEHSENSVINAVTNSNIKHSSKNDVDETSKRSSTKTNSENLSTLLSSSQKDLHESEDHNVSICSNEAELNMKHISKKQKKNSSNKSIEEPSLQFDTHCKNSEWKNRKATYNSSNDVKEKVKMETGDNNSPNSFKKKHKKNHSDRGNKFNDKFQHKGHFHSMQNKNVKTETDKRLALSDERLAAYGINPKKFKNKIKYSKQ